MTYDDITAALTEAGISVKYPGAKQDICFSPSAVVQNSGTFPYAGSSLLGYTLITVHCYAPIGAYPLLGRLIESVKSALTALEPDLRPTGHHGVHLINDRFRAHEGYVQYMIQRRTILS